MSLFTGTRSDIGPRGPAGPKGDQGQKGDTGDQGQKGDTGDKGDKGDRGVKGDAGPRGLQGDKGNPGVQGNRGPQGIQGLKGDKGDQGDKGDKGDQGDQGDKGDQGDRGLTGPRGDRGFQGLRGPQGLGAGPGTTFRIVPYTGTGIYSTSDWQHPELRGVSQVIQVISPANTSILRIDGVIMAFPSLSIQPTNFTLNARVGYFTTEAGKGPIVYKTMAGDSQGSPTQATLGGSSSLLIPLQSEHTLADIVQGTGNDPGSIMAIWWELSANANTRYVRAWSADAQVAFVP